MLEGVTDKSTLTGLGLPKRTVARLGALLSRGVAFTEAVLESAEKGSSLEALLLSARLLEGAPALDSELLAELVAESHVDDNLVIVDSVNGRVVALDEEVEADRAWDNPGASGEKSLTDLARRPSLAPAPSGDSSARAELFAPAEIERLKLTALTSARADEAIGAMRQLAYAPLAPAEKSDVFVRALAALDSEVRAEAARLLATVGLPPEVSEALTSLASGEEPEKRLAIDRLGKALAARKVTGNQADLAVISAVVALTSALSTEASVPIRGHVLSSLAAASSVLAAFPERLAEVLRRVVELLVADYSATINGALELLPALRTSAHAEFAPLVEGEIEKTQNARVRALLIAELAAAAREDGEPETQARACEMLATEFATGGQSPADRQTLVGELFRMEGDQAAGAVLANFASGGQAAQRYFLRLLADLCRYRQLSTVLVESTGQTFLGCLKGAAKELRLGVFETLLPSDTRLSPELRGSLAAAYLENFSDLVFRPDIELAETTLARMGLPALPELIQRMEPSWPPEDRTRACRIIGEMGRLAMIGQITDANLQPQLRDTTRRLLRTSANDFPAPGVLGVALGKLAAAIEEDLSALETVWHRVEALNVSEANRLEALSWIACGRDASEEMLEASTKRLLSRLTAPEPESLGEVTEVRAGTERVLELSSEASEFVEAMPAVVRGLARVALAPRTPSPLRSRVLAALINRWKDLVSGRCIWGPAAATVMIEGLRDLASHDSAGSTEKLEVIRALGLRLADPPAMRAIAEILAAERPNDNLGAPAASAALALLGLRDQRGRFPEEDREHVLCSLALILGRKEIDTSNRRTSKLRERIVEELFEGLNDGVPGVYEALGRAADSEGLPTELREELSSRLATRRALTVHTPRR